MSNRLLKVSHVLVSILKPPICIFIFLKELTKRLNDVYRDYFSWNYHQAILADILKIFPKTLSSNYIIRNTILCCDMCITWYNFCITKCKNKSARNMLNKREPKNEPYVTPITIYMNHLLVPFFFCLISSYGSFSRQVKQNFMCLASK